MSSTNRVIVHYLGAIALASIIGAVTLVAMGKTPPDSLLAVGAASAVGALGGVLIPAGRNRGKTSSVTIEEPEAPDGQGNP